MKQIGIIAIFIILILSCKESITKQAELKLSDVEFDSIFGIEKKNANNIYCLLGTGFFLTPHSDMTVL